MDESENYKESLIDGKEQSPQEAKLKTIPEDEKEENKFSLRTHNSKEEDIKIKINFNTLKQGNRSEKIKEEMKEEKLNIGKVKVASIDVRPDIIKEESKSNNGSENAIIMIKKGIGSIYIPLIFFINRKSGSKEGEKILNMIPKEGNPFLVKEVYQVWIYDMLTETETGRKTILSLLDQFEKVKIIVGGGDGSIISFIECLGPEITNTGKCVFGVVPLGTGNDLSRALNFGGLVDVDFMRKNFGEFIESYIEAEEVNIDIWFIKLTCDLDKGDVMEVEKNSDTYFLKSIQLHKTMSQKHIFMRNFINYMSFGYDARVGFGFNKSRTNSRCCNKCVYFWEGCKKTCCMKTLPVRGFLSSFQVVSHDCCGSKKTKNVIYEECEKLENDSNVHEGIVEEKKDYDEAEENQTFHEDQSSKEVIFQSKSPEVHAKLVMAKIESTKSNKSHFTKTSKDDEFSHIALKGDPVSLICQNINYYMAGTSDIWKKSNKKSGLKFFKTTNPDDPEAEREVDIEENDKYYSRITQEQKMDDKKLEFFTYSNAFDIGLEHIITGNANKIYQGPAPVIITFKETPERNKEDKYNRVYMNIDGEYYYIHKPKELRIRQSNTFPNGSLKFIRKKDS